MYLYNRWKGEAQGNLKALIQYLRNHADSRQLLRISELKDPRAFAQALAADRVLGPLFRERFSHEGKKLLNVRGLRDKSDSVSAAPADRGDQPRADRRSAFAI